MRRRELGVLVVLVLVVAMALAWSRPEPAVPPSPLDETLSDPVPARAPEPAPSAGSDPDSDVVNAEPEPEEASPALIVHVERIDDCREDAGDDACDRPILGALVGVRLVAEGELTTSDAGAWFVTGLTDSQGDLVVSDAGAGVYSFHLLEPSLVAEPAEHAYDGDQLTVTLPASAPAELELKVVDAHGRAVPHADVEVVLARGTVYLRGETNAEGLARFGPVTGGHGSLRVTAEGFAAWHDEDFHLAGVTRRTVQLSPARRIAVRVERPPGSPPLVVRLLGGTNYSPVEPLAPGAPGVVFSDAPPMPLIASVSESGALFGAIVAKVVPVQAQDVTLKLDGEPLVVTVEGPRPRTVWANGKCCAPHAVKLRCEERPNRRRATNAPPGEVRFEFVPALPCWVSYDDGPELRVWPGKATLHVD